MKPESEKPEGYHLATEDELTSIKNYAATHKALYDLVGLFITGPLKKEFSRPEVKAGLIALKNAAKESPRCKDAAQN